MDFSQNDDYIVCDDCGKQFISGDCPDHGPLEWYGDSQLSNETPKGDQAKLTLPNNLNIMPSAVWQGQLGVFAKARMEKQVIFGPFKGQKIPAKEFPLREDHNFKYMWDILEDGKVSQVIDGSDEQNSNWMKFVNCARDGEEQNLVAVQFRGEIYYKTCSPVESGTELLVWYGDSLSVKVDSLAQRDGHDYNCNTCGLVFAGSTFLRRHKAVRCPGLSPDQTNTVHDQTAIEYEPAQSSVTENTNNEVRTSPRDAESLYVVDIGTTINGTNSTIVEEGSRYVRVLQLEPASSSRSSNRGGRKAIKQAATTKGATKRNPSAQNTRKAKRNSRKSNVAEAQKIVSSNTTKARSSSSGKKSLSSERTSRGAKRTTNSRRGDVIKKKQASSGSDKSQVQKNTRNSKAKGDMSANSMRSSSDTSEDVLVREESSGKEINESSKKSKSEEAEKQLNNSKSPSSRKRTSEGDEGSTAGEVKKRKRTVPADKPIFTCEQCFRNFKWKSQLNYHMRSHSEIKEFVCSFCDKRLSQLSSLKRHLRVHSGEKPFGCEECGKRFVEKGKLTLHLRKHSGEPLEKKFKCSICDRGFTLSANLRTHIRTHTGEKPYPCPQCGKGFKRSSDIISHLRSHTGERPYKCSHCDKCFTMISHRNRHEVIHTGEKPFKCELCGKGFTQPNSVKAHLKVHERRQAKLSGGEMRQEKQKKNFRDGEIQTDVRPGTDNDVQQGVLHSVALGQGTCGERTEKLLGVQTQITENGKHLQVPIDGMHQKDSENAQFDQEPRPTVQPEDVPLSSINVEGPVGVDVASRDKTELTTIATEQLKLSYTGQDNTSELLTFDNTLVNSKALLQISSAAPSGGVEHCQLELAPASVQDQLQQTEENETTLFAL